MLWAVFIGNIITYLSKGERNQSYLMRSKAKAVPGVPFGLCLFKLQSKLLLCVKRNRTQDPFEEGNCCVSFGTLISLCHVGVKSSPVSCQVLSSAPEVFGRVCLCLEAVTSLTHPKSGAWSHIYPDHPSYKISLQRSVPIRFNLFCLVKLCSSLAG